VDGVLSRLLVNILRSVHSFFSSSTINLPTSLPTTDDRQAAARQLQAAARRAEIHEAIQYARETVIERETLRQKAKRIWYRRRSSLFLSLRPPWR